MTGTLDYSGFLSITDNEVVIGLSDLQSIIEMDEYFTALTVTSWSKNTEVTVGFLFSDDNHEEEDQEGLYKTLATKTLTYSE